MKYRCLGPYIFENKEYKFGDVIVTNKKIEKSGVIVCLDNTEEKVEKTEEKITKTEEKIKTKSTPRRK